ncbi:MAG: hypothetical protein CVU39_10440 [Chloroflexi bacterium HGW-Chloroflexi-10]|nr:MAG: hypothetical protein CVU39_10440 [Chloroflexi bacterium HGW-Chloroflexi-10]
MIHLPGLIDAHVHVREPGATHKEDWESATRAALAGGFTQILAMPNTQPPVCDAATLQRSLAQAQSKASVDYGQYLGAGAGNSTEAASLAPWAAGLKLYLDQTYGPLRLTDEGDWAAHLRAWPDNRPLLVHAEGETLARFLALLESLPRMAHICHVATREDILALRQAIEAGLPVTCEVSAHHLFLCEDDLQHLPQGMREVRPRLATKADQQALWDNLDVVDCFASDHAPHTLAEKMDGNPPPGFPGLETSLPLFLTAVQQERLTLEDIISRCYENPRRIFGLTAQAETWLEIDPQARWEIRAQDFYTRCGWTPFEGMPVQGKITRVVLRGKTVFAEGRLLAVPGSGRGIFPSMPVLPENKQ